jgi:hypothetical protein
MPYLRHVAGFAGILAILAVLAVAPAAAQEAAQEAAPGATPDATGVDPGEQDWLFVLQGQLTEVSDTTLSLRPDPQVVAFTDRPRRLARLSDAATLALAWGEGEPAKADPPNASLVNEADGELGVIEITDLSGEGVTVTFRRLEGTLPAVGDRIALTIDGLGAFDYKKLLNLKSLKSLKSL